MGTHVKNAGPQPFPLFWFLFFLSWEFVATDTSLESFVLDCPVRESILRCSQIWGLHTCNLSSWRSLTRNSFMYEAPCLFHKISLDTMVRTTMISVYVWKGMNSNALEGFQWLLQEKRKSSLVPLINVLPACVGLAVQKLKNELYSLVHNDKYWGSHYKGDIVMNGYAGVHHRLQEIPVEDFDSFLGSIFKQ